MSMFRNLFYFILTNILVMLTISVATSVICYVLFGVPYPPSGSIVPLIVWSGVWGFSGAFISLLMSKWMAKKTMGLRVIDPRTASGVERELVDTVHNLARAARLPAMPEVAIYDSGEMNAFATGPSKSNSLVAVSTGLMRKMSKDELDGVLGHEVAHIANGDMVGMTLVQGVVNSFVLFFSRIVASIAAQQVDDKWRGMVHHLLYIVLQILFGMLGSMVVCYYSRAREYRADSGSARFAGRGKMISALKALQRQHEPVPDSGAESIAALQISSAGRAGIMNLFRTHPALEDRIANLERGA